MLQLVANLTIFAENFHFNSKYKYIFMQKKWPSGFLKIAIFLKKCQNLQYSDSNQGCQMVCFQTKNPNLGKFWRDLEWKMLVYFMVIWNILRSFGTLHGHFGNVVVIWYIFLRFGMLCQEKSGNPDSNPLTPCSTGQCMFFGTRTSLQWSVSVL
jgi:hypothetical protein